MAKKVRTYSVGRRKSKKRNQNFYNCSFIYLNKAKAIMNKKIERYLQDKIFPDLEKARPDLDKPHTRAVVMWLKEILKHKPELQLDEDVLIISSYAHDWGYSGLFEKYDSKNLESVKKVKPLHMQLGAKKIVKLLDDSCFDFLSENQKQRIVHLVEVHDKIRELKDKDELVLMEADTLGAIDTINLKPIFDKSLNEEYMKFVVNTRRPKFVTEFGKKKFLELTKLREEYYKD